MEKDTSLRDYATPPNTMALSIMALSITAMNTTTLSVTRLSMTTQYDNRTIRHTAEQQ